MKEKKKRDGIFSKMQYKLDNALSKGMKSMVFILLSTVIFLSLIFGVGLALSSNDISLPSGVWTSVMHIIDPGTLAADESKNIVYMVLMSVATVLGVVFISTLIGIINTSIMLKLEKIKKGKSKIIEHDHIIILGFDEEIYTIIKELITANTDESKKKKTIVILDNNHTPEEMEDAVNKRIPNKKHTNIVYRKGLIYDVDSISLCSVNTCRSVIVNVESDYVTIKCILAVASILKDNNKVHITAVIKNSDYKEAAKLASNNNVKLLNFEDIIARVIAQSSRYTGASYVFEELFNFSGSEFYTITATEKTVGIGVNEMNIYCKNAVFVGKELKDEKGEPKVYLYPCIPENEKIIKAGDKLVFVAENSNITFSAEPHKTSKNRNISLDKFSNAVVNNTLILRYSSKIETILDEEYKFIGEGSKITIAVKEEHLEKIEKIKARENYEQLDIVKTDFSTESLKALIKRTNPESVIVLASTSDNRNDFEMSDERRKMIMHREDSEIILLLLQLRSFFKEKDEAFRFNVTSEIQYSENQKLAKDTGVNDFVVGTIITNEILAQVAHQKNRLSIFQEIISAGDADIIFRPATDFLSEGVEITIFDIFSEEAISAPEYVFIGYKKGTPDKNGKQVFINPDKKSTYVCNKDDLFIFIGQEQ